MKTIKYRETLPNATGSEVTCMEIGPQNHSKITVVMHSASTNTRMKIYYLFDEDNTATDTAKEIQTIDLTQNVLTIVNFDMKLRRIRITRDDTGSAWSGGALHVDGTTAKQE